MQNRVYIFAHLRLFDVKFLFRKQKKTAVYGRVSLVSDFKLNREIELPHSAHEYTKIQIPDKKYLINAAHIF